MSTIINWLENNGEFLKIGLVGLSMVVLLIMLMQILRQVKKLNENLKSITSNVQAYFDVILTEEDEPEEQQEAEEPEERIRAKVEALRKREEDEKLFNTVMHEYFS